MDLVDLQEYKEYKRLQNVQKDPNRQALISYVSKLVETYCNRTFLEYAISPGITEYYSALTTRVYLNHFPVLEVYSVKTSPDAGQTYTELTEGAASTNDGFIVDYEGGVVMNQVQRVPFLYSADLEYNSFEISYRAGYDEIPDDLKLAVFDMVHYYEQEEKSINKSLMGGSLENAMPFNESNFPPHIERILSLYRAQVSESFSNHRFGWPRKL